ncbi:hypothetical protein B0A48_03411 [Cryoendolithus antarcticus]|uniref:Uncharacterized protein n=1 Tax=Cryoendolithus antarcticus TaxID=1507870 RepID=A0A1V8TK51_9PEZI|nr:hypothetical protein B0A48_03411 [Cryoendolithus antarcticus]
MPPTRAGRKRFFHEINEDVEEASPWPADVTMENMAPMSHALRDDASEASEGAAPQHALSSEGTMRESSRLSSTSTIVATDTGFEGGGVALTSDPVDSSSTLAHDSVAPPSESSHARPLSPRCEPASPYTLPVNHCDASNLAEDADHHSEPLREDEIPPFCNYLNYCGYFDQTTIPLASLSSLRIRKVIEQFEGADPSYYHNFITAYLSETTFTAKVWINFDPSRRFPDSVFDRLKNHQGFYTDRRAEDTGILHLPCSSRTYLQGLDQDVYRFQHIRLDICTPFRRLATLAFDFTMTESLEGFMFKISGNFGNRGTIAGFEYLRSFIRAEASKIQEWVKEYNVQGLDIAELNAIALLFRNLKDEGDGERTGWMKEPCPGGGDWCVSEEEVETVVQSGGCDGYVPFAVGDVAW